MRGLDEASVPSWQRDHHVSAPRTVGFEVGDRTAEVSYSFYLLKYLYEPVSDTPDMIVMMLSWADAFMVIGAPIAIGQLPVLREVFEEYATTFPPGGAQ